MSEIEPHPGLFWAFSLRVYGDPEVARGCLELQDAWGADVNLVLFVLWHGSAGYRLDREQVLAIDALVRPWREDVVRPLRGVRRSLKTSQPPWASAETEKLRARIKAEELEAERLQHEVLEAAFPLASIGTPETPAEATLAANLLAYAQVIEAGLPASLVASLCARVRARASGS